MNQIRGRKNKRRKEIREGNQLILRKLQKHINKLMINQQLLHQRNRQQHMKIILNSNSNLKSSKMIKSLKTGINLMIRIKEIKIKRNNHSLMMMNTIREGTM